MSVAVNFLDARMPAEFWERCSPCPVSGCWLWTGWSNGKGGYGKFRRGHYAHRLSYESLVGRIPNGMVLDHLCRTTCCVNPAHLEPVTQQENTMRGRVHTELATHCKRGHPYDESNAIHRTRNGRPRGRECRACLYARVREFKRRRRLEARAA